MKRAPTKDQWLMLRNILSNGWGDGDFANSRTEDQKGRRALSAFDRWLEDRYKITFSYPLIGK